MCKSPEVGVLGIARKSGGLEQLVGIEDGEASRSLKVTPCCGPALHFCRGYSDRPSRGS